jgi:hypothetical protein
MKIAQLFIYMGMCEPSRCLEYFQRQKKTLTFQVLIIVAKESSVAQKQVPHSFETR